MHIGRDEQAIEVLEEARQKNPESQALVRQMAQAQTNLCITAGKLKRFEESVLHFKEAVKLVPDFGPAHLAMGITLYQQGQYNKAIKLLKRPWKWTPTSRWMRIIIWPGPTPKGETKSAQIF